MGEWEYKNKSPTNHQWSNKNKQKTPKRFNGLIVICRKVNNGKIQCEERLDYMIVSASILCSVNPKTK